MTEGRSPFRLVEMVSERDYYEGVVEYLADTPTPGGQSDEKHLLDRFEKCHLLLFGQPWERRDTGEHFALSYRMAGRLPIEHAGKQALLEMRSEHDRQSFLLQWLEDLLPKLTRRQHGRDLAGGNGHALN